MTDEADAAADKVQEILNSDLSRDDIDAVLAGLATVGGPEGLSLNDANQCDILDESGRSIIVMYRPPFPGVVLLSSVFEEGGLAPEMLCSLLQANRIWGLTGGGTFSMTEPNGPVLLSTRVLTVDRDPANLARSIKEFSDLVEAWETEICFGHDALEIEKAARSSVPEAPGAQIIV